MPFNINYQLKKCLKFYGCTFMCDLFHVPYYFSFIDERKNCIINSFLILAIIFISLRYLY